MTQCAEFAGQSWATCTRGLSGCICGLENAHRAAHVLEQHNKWRRGADDAPVDMIHPAAVGRAIDTAIKALRTAATQQPQTDRGE